MSAIKSYLRLYFWIVLSGAIAVLGFNLVVDPDHIVRVVEIEGFNREKPLVGWRGLSRVKALALETGEYDTLIIGNSRVFWGLDPQHPILRDRSVYNAGIRSAGSYQVYKIFEFARQHQDLKTVVLGLDITSFFPNRPRILPNQDFGDSRFVSNRPTLVTNFSSFLARTTLANSWKTVRFNQAGRVADRYTDQGFRNPIYPKIDRLKNFKQNAHKMLSNRYPAGVGYDDITLSYFRRIVKRCKKENIELKLFIEPNHAIALEWLLLTRKWKRVERWKTEIVNIVAESYGDEAKVWDFTGYNSINTEALPTLPAAPNRPIDPDDPAKAEMWGYLDPLHYKKDVGDLILAKLFSEAHRASGSISDPTTKLDPSQVLPTLPDLPEDFGTLIPPDQIHDHLMQIRAGRDSYKLPKF